VWGWVGISSGILTAAGSQDDSDRERLFRAESCRSAATIGRQNSSRSTGDLLCPLYVDSGGLQCAKSGHSRQRGERVKSS